MDRARELSRQAGRYKEVFVGLFLLAVFSYLLLTLEDHVAGVRGGRAFVEPDFWPRVLLTLGIVFTVVYMVTAVIRARPGRHVEASVLGHLTGGAVEDAEYVEPARRRDEGPPQEEGAATAAEEEAEKPPRANVLALVGAFLLLLGYIYFMPTLGFVLVTVVFCVLFLLLVGERRWPVLVILPVAAAAVVVFVFTRLLVVPLPRGTGIFVELSTYLY